MRCSAGVTTRSTAQEPRDWEPANLSALLTPASDTAAIPLSPDEEIDFWDNNDACTATTNIFSDSEIAHGVNPLLSTDDLGAGATVQILPHARSTVVEATLSSVAHDVFHNLGTLRLESRALDGSIQYPEVYARISQVSQAFVQLLKDVEYGHAPFLDLKERTYAEVEDADIICTMSCFLKLLTGYERIFTFWLDLMTSSLEDAALKATFRHTITHSLPTVSIGSFVAPPCYLSQLRLVLDVAGCMYDEFQNSLKRFAKALDERNRATSMERISYMSDTTTGLVVSRERSVALTKQKVLECSRDEGLKKRIDMTLAPI
ncbi:uncharacterized protein ALTATR162_LOCUS210 [Alternaria atra]|uniref:Uncharacterized protein n=1 Tax=Alternaria atra TaxID=119953 RepID=A0A8J2N132_9PLEO|nr:uncharacterized protein ALTATR162_LOCUS210 [Alternaria atra]CAG5137794.1 unnamed protein product [Alternaria atra]